MSFTELFEAKAVSDKMQFVAEERNRRVKQDIDKYVAIPVGVPLMGKVTPEPKDFKLGWAIGVPGSHQDDSGKPARAALTLGFPDEEAAEDFCAAMNQARDNRTGSRIM